MFAQQGARVVVSDLDGAKSDEVAREINAQGGVAISVPGDVTKTDFADNILDRTVREFGKVTIVSEETVVRVMVVLVLMQRAHTGGEQCWLYLGSGHP